MSTAEILKAIPKIPEKELRERLRELEVERSSVTALLRVVRKENRTAAKSGGCRD